MKTLSDRELATVLYGLRKVEEEWETNHFTAPQSEHFEEVSPLNADEIDTLCERLNVDDAFVDADEARDLARELAAPVNANADAAEWMNRAQRLARLVLDAPPADGWPHASAALRAEKPWCGWVVAFGENSECDTTEFGLKPMVNINLLLTTADGRSRPATILSIRAVGPDGETGGILVHELDPTDYEPLPNTQPEFVAYQAIRELVVY